MPVDRRAVPSARVADSSWMPLGRWVLCGWLPSNTPRTWLGVSGFASGSPTTMFAITRVFLLPFIVSSGSQRRWVRVIVRDLAVADHEVVREHAANGLVESAADRVVGHLEFLEHLDVAGVHTLERLVDEIQRHRRRVGDEVRARAVAFDRVRALRDLPLELDLAERCRLR